MKHSWMEDLKGCLISEISKKKHSPEDYLPREKLLGAKMCWISIQPTFLGAVIWHLFGNWSQSEKLSKIKLHLMENHAFTMIFFEG